MESWVSLGGKERCTNIRISAKPGIEPGTLWSEGRDLTNCANHARPWWRWGWRYWFCFDYDVDNDFGIYDVVVLMVAIVISIISNLLRRRKIWNSTFLLDLDARPWDFQAEECALRACVDRFNNRRYGLEIDAEKEEDKFTPVDNNLMSVLGRRMELGAEFKENYEKWLDREVFSASIDWDQLCSCPSNSTIKIKPGTSSVWSMSMVGVWCCFWCH